MNEIRHCDVTTMQAVYMDCCLPDYFNGNTSGAHEILAVPVSSTTTYREAREAIDTEFHASSGWFDQVAGSGGMLDDALVALFKPSINHMDDVADFVNGIEPVDDDDNDTAETVYLYIGLIGEE